MTKKAYKRLVDSLETTIYDLGNDETRLNSKITRLEAEKKSLQTINGMTYGKNGGCIRGDHCCKCEHRQDKEDVAWIHLGNGERFSIPSDPYFCDLTVPCGKFELKEPKVVEKKEETLLETAQRLCLSRKNCVTCPLSNIDGYAICDKARLQCRHEISPERQAVIRGWGARNPPKEK